MAGMRRPSFISAMMLLLLASSACNSATEPRTIDVEDVVFTARKPTLEIRNNTDKPIFYFVVGRNASAYTDWYPCVDETECPTIPPKGTLVKTYQELGIQQTEVEALVWWWHAVTVDGQRKPEFIHQGLIKIR